MGEAIAMRNDAGAIQQTSEGFGTNTMVRANETATAAVAAQARAQIEARYIVAMRNPRDMDNVRAKLLKECARPGFADVARYRKPVGRERIEGPSIRFAEAALRCMGNVVPESMVIWDDEEKRVVRVSVTDIESNLTYSTDVVVAKTVERQKLAEGQQALSSRTNSFGKTVYTVRATEDDLLNKQNAQVSKALRTQSIRLLPGDILAECMEKVIEVQGKRDAQDPDAARKKLLDAFQRINVMPSHLAEYLGHDTAQVGPAELAELRAVFAAISEGETTWSAVMASKKPNEDGETTPAAQKAVEAVKARLQAKKGAPPANQQVIIDADTGEVTEAKKQPEPPKSGLVFSKHYTVAALRGKPLEDATGEQRAAYSRYLDAILKDPSKASAHEAIGEHKKKVDLLIEQVRADEELGDGAGA